MTWLVSNWRWASLNFLGASVLVILLSWGNPDWTTNSPPSFDPELESGKWAIRFLLICLAMSPLQIYFGWRGAIPLRKPAGLWSFGFAFLHVLFYIRERGLTWLTWPLPLFIGLGLSGLLVLSLLALTSNRWAMRRLKKGWKRLHRLVYLIGPTVIYHAILSTEASKKVLFYDPQAIRELNLYLALLIVFLGVRIPPVRRVLKQSLSWRRPRHPVDHPVTVTLPDRLWRYGPWLNGHETDLPLNETLTEAPEIKSLEIEKVR